MAPERVIASLAGRILYLERFTEISESETHNFIEAQKNRNIWRKTEGDVKLFTDWLLEGENERRNPDPHSRDGIGQISRYVFFYR